MEEPIYLERKILDEMIAHARQEAPDECCGIIAGQDGKIVKIYPTSNEEKSPEKYRIPAREMFKANKDINSRGLDFIGVYHSHTHTEAYPSPTDVSLAIWPEALYLIVSLAPPAPGLRAFTIVDGRISEVAIKIS